MSAETINGWQQSDIRAIIVARDNSFAEKILIISPSKPKIEQAVVVPGSIPIIANRLIKALKECLNIKSFFVCISKVYVMMIKIKKRLFGLVIFLMLISLPSYLALVEPYHLKLLAVEEVLGNYSGVDADLYLELKPGSGRVFLDTYPLTKMDTQISTRFAKEIACKHFKLDCNQYDFIFTIKAKSNIIGGPSAGAAIAALTTIAVLDLDYDQSITITATINSGGTIGPVGGVKEKLEAASKIDLKKVLITKGTGKQRQSLIFNSENDDEDDDENIDENIDGSDRDKINDENVTGIDDDKKSSSKDNDDNDNNDDNNDSDDNDDNVTKNNDKDTNQTEEFFDLIKYGQENLSLEIVEVTDLDDVVRELTGVELNHKVINVSEDEEYKKIMQGLQNVLCSRTAEIEENFLKDNLIINQDTLNKSLQKKESSRQALEEEDYYSAASFCFSNNILLKESYYRESNLSLQQMARLFLILEKKTLRLEEEIKKFEIQTISDLQTLIIVKERLNDVKLKIKDFNQIYNSNNSSNIINPNLGKIYLIENNRTREAISLNKAVELIAYGEERLFSALSWMQFFSMEGKKFSLDSEMLKNSCQQKIFEAEERYQYASIFLGSLYVVNIKEKVDLAKSSLDQNEPELCLIKAAQAKAEANAVLSSLGLTDDIFAEFLESKSKAVERVIFENNIEGIFPILGYSYYQYANSLKEDEQYTALIYLEYALEMSDLSIYFPEKEEYFFRYEQFKFKERWIYFLLGMFVGILLATLVFMIERNWFKKRPKLDFVREK